ncbi:helix-turn-helix domain-containing protein [Flavihumibacter sp. UBA7668]|uniref:helix-turn-helix domain-containing protein n=1 Tax=Flavihumibacter sp. UBA7668 TaxID=1946542 RepID=UPI0025BE7340|nr:XRE family transcriptional regulator [Flavihumibacter sp. UBA7668]
MQEDLLIQISNKIKEVRKAKDITVQELANRAEVSKGLISQIENNRAIPSLPVLMKVIFALEIDLADFFDELKSAAGQTGVVIVRKENYKSIEKESDKGFDYKRILTRTLTGGSTDIVLLSLKKGASRKKVVHTEAYEFKYVIQGSLQYDIEGQQYRLEQGDSIFFDGRLGHRLSNPGVADTLMLVVYFFINK